MKYKVVADNSFYCCLCDDIGEINTLKKLLDMYNFFIGNNLIKELPAKVSENNKIISSLTTIEQDYKKIFEPLLNREKKHHDDGEYEAIGIAHYFIYVLNDKKFKYIIMEDKHGRKFINNYFQELKPYLTGTPGFIFKACEHDGYISKNSAINVMENMKAAIENADKLNINHRPCSMCTKDYGKILLPLLSKLKSDYNG